MKRKNKPIRRPDAVQPLPLPADADEIAFAHGVSRRVVVVDDDGELIELVNPEILETSGEQDGMEGCLSVPGRYGMVKRPEFVRLRAQDRDGNWFEAEGEGLTARCFAHECDHLDGHIYTERAYHMLTDEEMAELEEEAFSSGSLEQAMEEMGL